jgi:hypothetical protein
MNFDVYCDESGQELFGTRAPGEHYVLIGSLWVRAENRKVYKEYIKQLRSEHKVGGEFKWKRVSPSRLNFFLELVRFFFEQRDEMRFRVIVLRADEMDAVRFHESDNELMFYKFYYQVLHHWILDFNRYRVFVDTKTNRLHSRIRTLEKCLKYTNLSSLVEVQALPSHEVDLLQLVDVLTGAVSYKFHKRDTSAAKLRVLAEIERHLGKEITPTLRSEDKFNVFRFQAGGGW